MSNVGPLKIGDLSMPRPGELPDHDPEYLPTRSMPWLNDALGSGFARGSVCLLSGDSGVGKSTIALQALGDLAQQGVRCLYLTSEQELRDLEAAIHRILGNSRGRLPDGVGRNLHMDDRVGDLGVLPDFLERHVLSPVGDYAGCRAIVLDSIHGRGLSSSATSAYKALYAFTERAKAAGIVTILIGHVTKQGQIAGPKTLQHNVDVVMHIQRAFVLRPLFVPKNRFGPAALEPIILEMDSRGRIGRSPHVSSKCVQVYGFAGKGRELAEVQAMVNFPKFGSDPIKNAPDLPKEKIRQIIRILGSLANVGLGELSHEINLYIPGNRGYSNELDLALAVALLASYLQMEVPDRSLFVGEVDLMKQVRPLNAYRLQELVELLVRDPGQAEHLFLAESLGDRFGESSGDSWGRRVGKLMKVRGVGDLESVVRMLWPEIMPR